jgi:hypothetical protein
VTAIHYIHLLYDEMVAVTVPSHVVPARRGITCFTYILKSILHRFLKGRRYDFRIGLKGLSHEIFGPVFLAVWMYLGLNVNRLWFLNFNYALLILDIFFKF